MKLDHLPSSYKVPSLLKVGTNRLENVTALFSFNGFVPLLIGSGNPPRVWINIPANSAGSEWYPLVKDNFSTHPQVKVQTKGGTAKISTPDGVVVEVKKDSDGSLDVAKLDLRPFGLNAYADKTKLVIMGTNLSGNTMRNVGVMVGVGDDA